MTVVVRYGVGEADEPPGKGGLAHVVEHLMSTAGSKHAPYGFLRGVARVTAPPLFSGALPHHHAFR